MNRICWFTNLTLTFTKGTFVSHFLFAPISYLVQMYVYEVLSQYVLGSSKLLIALFYDNPFYSYLTVEINRSIFRGNPLLFMCYGVLSVVDTYRRTRRVTSAPILLRFLDMFQPTSRCWWSAEGCCWVWLMRWSTISPHHQPLHQHSTTDCGKTTTPFHKKCTFNLSHSVGDNVAYDVYY